MATFRPSARTVDMLGRQQIADTATAVTELWKNAYDAYATSARAFHLFDRRVLIVADDGMGMDRATFLSRWLTLGTSDKESKTTSPRSKAYAESLGMDLRPVMGEKGIGRLALALLGPQALVLTRGRTEAGVLETTIAWLCWDLFELPGLLLEQVQVPVTTTVDQAPEFAPMVASLRADMLAALTAAAGSGEELGEPDRERCLAGIALIKERVKALDLDVAQLLATTDLSLRTGTGTAFFVSPVAEQLEDDVTRAVRSGSFTGQDVNPFDAKFFRLVRDFTDRLTPPGKGPRPDFTTKYTFAQGVDDVVGLSPDDFDELEPWTREDLERADHVFEGSFDEFGHWRGDVRLYSRDPERYERIYTPSEGNLTACGPFHVTIGYLEPLRDRSRLSGADREAMKARLDRASGLYVFRDGIRVLPYGSFEIDYLGIEERRSKKAGRAYFSYRNMFGAVSLTSESNGALREKAGREGFRQDRAFRAFRDVLVNLLEGLAFDFLSTEATQAEGSVVAEERAALARRAAMTKAADQRAAEQRSRFGRRLAEAATGIDEALAAVPGIVERAELRVRDDRRTFDPEAWFDELESLRRMLPVNAPAGIGMTRDQRDDLADINDRYERELVPMLTKARTRITELAVEANAFEAVDVMSSRAAAVAAEARSQIDDAVSTLVSASRDRASEIEEAAGRVGAGEGIEAAQQEMERLEALREGLSEAVDVILRAAEDVREHVSLLVIDAVRQERVAELEAELDSNAELAQIGMAVAVISHEFESNVKGIRDQLRRLRRWGTTNENLKTLADGLSASFEHLDGYLRLFTPLQRRLHRSASEITGTHIAEFVEKLFGDRFEDLGVALDIRDEFRTFSIVGYPSTFLPVFVNIVDNALHWLAKIDGPRKITLAAEDGGLTVENNGPPISKKDRARIFQRGFTTRPGGRGLGLHLAREALRKSGWKLILDENFDEGTRFLIRGEDGGDGS